MSCNLFKILPFNKRAENLVKHLTIYTIIRYELIAIDYIYILFYLCVYVLYIDTFCETKPLRYENEGKVTHIYYIDRYKYNL